jgi:hypothetical protein
MARLMALISDITVSRSMFQSASEMQKFIIISHYCISFHCFTP